MNEFKVIPEWKPPKRIYILLLVLTIVISFSYFYISGLNGG
ncbi:MAG: hypothetical protein Q7S37_04120 [bacterium]|nr:hypothetical protein [bacterium]